MPTFTFGPYKRITVVVEYVDPDQRPVVMEFDQYPALSIAMERSRIEHTVSAEGYMLTELGAVETPSEFLAAREAKEVRS